MKNHQQNVLEHGENFETKGFFYWIFTDFIVFLDFFLTVFHDGKKIVKKKNNENLRVYWKFNSQINKKFEFYNEIPL